MEFSEFLVSVPPGKLEKDITDLAENYNLRLPSVFLDCESPQCDTLMIFDGRCAESSFLRSESYADRFITYTCRHCRKTNKTYSIRARLEAYSTSSGMALKIGEWPPFGSRIPSRVISLVGTDRELFLKGKRAEDQGMGIGAFVYYRRIVENQKNRIIDEIIRVSKHIDAPTQLIKALEQAKKETQFKRAIDVIKDGIPEVLKIKGHNPLTLLYTPLSQGIHDKSDEECLALATSVRVILTDLAEKIDQALIDQAEINEAVRRLLKSGGKKSTASGKEGSEEK